MPKSSHEKIEFAKKLLDEGIPYTEIQNQLKSKYGTGMSNTSLQNLNDVREDYKELRNRLDTTELELRETKIELNLYKKMYLEL